MQVSVFRDETQEPQYSIMLNQTEAEILCHVIGRGSLMHTTLDNLFDSIADCLDEVAGSPQQYSAVPTWLQEIGDNFFANERRLARSGY